MKTIYIKIAGITNLFTAFLHLIAGQMDLVTPLQNSALNDHQKSEWLGAWHMITVLLFFTSVLILRAGFGARLLTDKSGIRAIGLFYALASIPFIVSSIYYSLLAPQWILLLPIGILLLIGTGNKR